jgi:hypothetical protein
VLGRRRQGVVPRCSRHRTRRRGRGRSPRSARPGSTGASPGASAGRCGHHHGAVGRGRRGWTSRPTGCRRAPGTRRGCGPARGGGAGRTVPRVPLGGATE